MVAPPKGGCPNKDELIRGECAKPARECTNGLDSRCCAAAFIKGGCKPEMRCGMYDHRQKALVLGAPADTLKHPNKQLRSASLTTSHRRSASRSYPPSALASTSSSSESTASPVAEDQSPVILNDASQTAPDQWHYCAGNSALAQDLNAQRGQGFDAARRKEDFLKKQQALKHRNIEVVIWNDPSAEPDVVPVAIDKVSHAFRLDLFPDVVRELPAGIVVQYYTFDPLLGVPKWKILPYTVTITVHAKVEYLLLRLRLDRVDLLPAPDAYHLFDLYGPMALPPGTQRESCASETVSDGLPDAKRVGLSLNDASVWPGTSGQAQDLASVPYPNEPTSEHDQNAVSSLSTFLNDQQAPPQDDFSSNDPQHTLGAPSFDSFVMDVDPYDEPMHDGSQFLLPDLKDSEHTSSFSVDVTLPNTVDPLTIVTPHVDSGNDTSMPTTPGSIYPVPPFGDAVLPPPTATVFEPMAMAATAQGSDFSDWNFSLSLTPNLVSWSLLLPASSVLGTVPGTSAPVNVGGPCLPDFLGTNAKPPTARWPSSYSFKAVFEGLRLVYWIRFGSGKPDIGLRMSMAQVFPLYSWPKGKKQDGQTVRNTIEEIERSGPLVWEHFCRLDGDEAGSFSKYRTYCGKLEVSYGGKIPRVAVPWPTSQEAAIAAAAARELEQMAMPGTG